jgi:hypothetical protein
VEEPTNPWILLHTHSGSLRGPSESASSRDLLWFTRRVERHLQRALDKDRLWCYIPRSILTISSGEACAVILQKS